MAPLISFVRVVFNSVTTFEESISCVINQNFKD